MSFEVKRAIIMAAGYGSRLKPVTDDVPKALLNVNGAPMIESVLKALLYNGIEDIIIVVGYKKELFYEALKTYSMITFIENPYYRERNNISSLCMAREFLGECDVAILDADQIINDHSILLPQFKRSGYAAIKVDGYTEEWLLRVNEDGWITSCSRSGGIDGYELHSISFWSANDGNKLSEYVVLAMENKDNWQLYWDDIALFLYPEEFKLGIREIAEEALIEIDTMEELAAADNRYERYLQK